MPTLDPPSNSDTMADAAPTFSEVLSLSSPDRPDPNGAAASSLPPPGPDEPRAETGMVAAVPEEAAAEPVRSPAKCGHQEADRPADRGSHGSDMTSSAVPGSSRSGSTGEITPSGPAPAPAQPQIPDADAEQGAASAPTPFASSGPPSPSTALAPASGPASGVLTTTTASTDAASLPPSTAPTDGPDHSGDASSIDALLTAGPPATVAAETPSAGADQGGGQSDGTPMVRTPDVVAAGGGLMTSVDHAGPFALSELHVGSTPAQPAGSASDASATVPIAGGAGAAGAAVTVAGSTDEGPGLIGFPQQGAGTAAQAVDVSDLAASISRPLAGGNGEYSVQVSLHPPELGEVRALLSLQGDVLHVTLIPEHASGLEALTDAMPALREQLAGGGLEVNVTLGQPGDPQGEESRRAVDPRLTGIRPSDDAALAVSPPPLSTDSSSPGRIHLVL